MATEWVRLMLDLDSFDDTGFRSDLAFATLAELGDTAEHRRKLYELNKTCAADIPERGEFYSFEEYLAVRIEVPGYDAAGVIVALDGTEWVGFSMTSIQPGFAFSEMTGVLAQYRGRGISLALKVRAIDFARRSGRRWLRAFHHPANAAAIGMNRRLGFFDDLQPPSEKWSTNEELAAAVQRFTAKIDGYVAPAAYGVARVDDGELTFGEVNTYGNTRTLPAVVLASVCGYVDRTATFPLTREQFAEAIDLLAPADAAVHMDHPNLWSWQALLAGAGPGSSFRAFYLANAGDATDTDFLGRL